MPTQRMRQVTNLLVAALQQPVNQREQFVRSICDTDASLQADVLDLLNHVEAPEPVDFEDNSVERMHQLFKAMWAKRGNEDNAPPSIESAAQLLDRIEQSQLARANEISHWFSGLEEATRPSTAQALALQLLRRGKLTAFQAAALMQPQLETLVLGNYEILDHIASGGMGRVYKARHRLMNRVVAVKLIAKEELDSPEAARRFRREMEAAARLNHANIVQAFDATEAEGEHLLAMEYVDGIDLSRLVSRVGPLPVRQAVDYILQAARGLAYAHENHVVHRDVKPSNLIIDRQNVLKVSDLGLARINVNARRSESATHDELTKNDHFVGTYDYSAPEQTMDARSVDHRADVYSLGCTLYFLLTARPVYEQRDKVAKVVAHRADPIPSLADSKPSVPSSLDELFSAMLAKDREARVQTMQDVAARLEEIVPTLPYEASIDPGQLIAADDIGRASAATDIATNTTAAFEAARAASQSTSQSQGVAPKTQRSSTQHWWWQAVAAMLLVAAGGVVAALILRVDTPSGTLVVAFDNAAAAQDVVVHVDDQKVRIEPTQDGKAITISVDPGRRSLRIDSADGTHFFADEIEIGRGATKLLSAKLESTKDPGIDPPRTESAIAKWLHELGAELKLRTDDMQVITVRKPDVLPENTFHVLSIDLKNQPSFSNDDVVRLRDLPHLQDVALYGVGTTDDCMAIFAQMKQLRTLSFGDANITGRRMDALAELPRLEYLNVGRNPIDPSTLQHVQDLSVTVFHAEHIYLADKDLEYLAEATQLTAVNFNSNPFNGEGFASLKNLTRLVSLGVENSHVDDSGLATIVNTFPDLAALNLFNTRVSDEGLDSITILTKLRNLNLDYNPQLSDDVLRHVFELDGLATLTCSRTPISDKSVSGLAKLKSLTHLDIIDTVISEAGHRRLAEALPDCTIRWSPPENDIDSVVFAREQEFAEHVVGAGGEVMLELKRDRSQSLEFRHGDTLPDEPFYVVGAEITESKRTTDSTLARFRQMPELRRLLLDSTQIGDIGASHIATMKGIQDLYISNTNVTKLGLQHLSQLPKLKTLGLKGVQLEGQDLRVLPTYLRNLYLTATTIRDLSGIGHFEQLSGMAISGAKLDEGAMRQAVSNGWLDSVWSLNVIESNITDADLHAITSRLKLSNLYIRGTSVSDKALRGLAAQVQMTRLHMHQCPNVSDTGIEYIAKAKQLQKLVLHDTPITDAAIEHLVKLKQLTDLNIERTGITEAGLARLKQALPNCEIQLSHDPPPM